VPTVTLAELDAMEREAGAYRGRPDDAWIGQYHLGTKGALELIDLARNELKRRVLRAAQTRGQREKTE
jgi:hypothetical protein